MFRIKYIRIFKHSWVIDNFYNRAYITCLRFLNSLSLLFMVLGWRKNAWFIRISYHAWVQSLQYGQKGSSRTRWIIGYVHLPISWNAEIDKTVLIPVCEIQIHFVCFFFYSNPNVNFEFFALIISEIKMNQSQWYWKGKYEQERKMVDR